MKCPNCNSTDHDPWAKFCHVCGGPLQTESSNNQNSWQLLWTNLNNKTVKKWAWCLIVVIILILLCVFLGSLFKKKIYLNRTPIENITKKESYPQDISGNYFVRMMDGRNDVNATIKIYTNNSEFIMNVYSASFTKQYSFVYDPSNGEIVSRELGMGKARIKELTNETEITFEGWKLVK